ncbi:hypothetical protein GALMADRAFT_149255 [Galerina marginata CBS 339.88]|uniref:CCHC-type domain-containing protein n=1 Tax=Galerina marginata (strain CBS 339.88) TaxID=685588 RepID=A0A067SAK9_GALM3|nr:hypothetical protein GALMADRAFT_149255 [Galerina marginata CBS 339.88]
MPIARNQTPYAHDLSAPISFIEFSKYMTNDLDFYTILQQLGPDYPRDLLYFRNLMYSIEYQEKFIQEQRQHAQNLFEALERFRLGPRLGSFVRQKRQEAHPAPRPRNPTPYSHHHHRRTYPIGSPRNPIVVEDDDFTQSDMDRLMPGTSQVRFVTCRQCTKLGHIKAKCPYYRCTCGELHRNEETCPNDMYQPD